MLPMTDLFRVTMSPVAGQALTELFTPDTDGRIYVGEGPRVAMFEKAFAAVTGLEQEPLGVNSCSAAIDLALHLVGVGPGDEVITTPITCSATNGPIVTRGAKVAWADVDQVTGNIDPRSVARLVTPRTRAIIAVDWGGRSCDYPALRRAASWGEPLPVIQDAAHRLYVDPDNHGDYVAWSFGPIKHLSMGGYGGALLVPPDQQRRARLLRWHGLDRRSKADYRCEQDIAEVGYRYHLTDDLATVGLMNLPLAVNSVARARENAAWYSQSLAGVPGLRLLPFDPQCDYWLYTLLVDHRDSFRTWLRDRSIASSQVHARNDKHTAFQAATACSDALNGVASFDSHQVSIPVGWWLTPDEREQVAEAVVSWAQDAWVPVW